MILISSLTHKTPSFHLSSFLLLFRKLMGSKTTPDIARPFTLYYVLYFARERILAEQLSECHYLGFGFL